MEKISIRLIIVLLPLACFIVCAITSGILCYASNPQYVKLAILSGSFLIGGIISLKSLISDFKKHKLIKQN